MIGTEEQVIVSAGCVVAKGGFRVLVCATWAMLMASSGLAVEPSVSRTLDHTLEAGLYEIEVSVKSAVSAEGPVPRIVRRCFTEAAANEHRVFEILSNTPAASCPKYEICTSGPRTGLQTLCEGAADASAVGMFELEKDRFRGRIDIDRDKPGRSLIELQYGKRVGDCPKP